METDKKQFSQKLCYDTISLFDDCLKIRNDQLSVTGSAMNKGELLDEMIRNYHDLLVEKTVKPDEKNIVSINKDSFLLMVGDAVKIELKKYSRLWEQIAFNSLRVNKLSEVILRTTCGTYEEQIEKRMNNFGLTKNQAIEQYNDFLSNKLFQPCPVVEAVDAELFDDGSDPIDE